MGGYCEAGCDTSVGLCSVLITLASMVLIVATLPLSLMFTVKVAQVGLLCVTQPPSSGTVWFVMMYVVSNLSGEWLVTCTKYSHHQLQLGTLGNVTQHPTLL